MTQFTQTEATASKDRPYLNLSGYRFLKIADPESTKDQLIASAEDRVLGGTILLGTEGINFSLAGSKEELNYYKEELARIVGSPDLNFKESYSRCLPFSRFRVKVKKEIIPMGLSGVDPEKTPAPRVSPEELKAWLDEKKDIEILDVRNDYETEIGAFEKAEKLDLRHFRNFAEALETLPDSWKEKPVVTYCTGGIRCEKAAPLMIKKGFKNVYQLDGGILKYLERCGSTHYEGACFVFDQRGALNPDLKEANLFTCYKCRNPLKSEESVCPFCPPSPNKSTNPPIARNL